MHTTPSHVRLDADTIQHATLGAALHGLSLEDYFNQVVRGWIVATNGLLVTQPPRPGTPRLEALINSRVRTRKK